MRAFLVSALAFFMAQAPVQQRPASTLPNFRSQRELNTFLGDIQAERRRRERERAEAWRRTAATPAPVPGPGVGIGTCPGVPGLDFTAIPAVIQGRVATDSGVPVVGGNVYITECNLQAATSNDGRYRLVVRGLRAESAQVAIRARAVGYRPASRSVALREGDSVEVDFLLVQDVNRLEEITVTGVTGPENAAITNIQEAGVDEGGIVKVHGQHLVVLRRGRLFTIAVGDEELRPVSSLDAFGPGIDPRGAWYDEMLVAPGRIVVIGYSYARDGTEIGVFAIDARGRLGHEATYHLSSNDYYSSRNYSSRLIGNRLVLYAPMYLPHRLDNAQDLFPTLRRWQPGDRGGRLMPTVRPERVYRPARWAPGDDVAFHTVTSCDLARRDLACEATVVIGPSGRVFYVSREAVYVWMSSWRTMRAANGGAGAPAILVRMPLDGRAPSALGVEGAPIDQFSFLEGSDGHLNVLVGATGYGDAMWRAEGQVVNAALLRVPLSAFGDGRMSAPRSRYRALPMPSRSLVHNRFVGDFLLYGEGTGWGPARSDSADLHLVPWRGGTGVRVRLAHGVDRIEVMGADAVVVGAGDTDLHFSGVRLRGRPGVVQRFTLAKAGQGETRSHGFFYRADAGDEGVLGLPVREARRSGYSQLFETSASVLYLRNRNGQFERLGNLFAQSDRVADDGCKASCVDWYGNARPIFLRGRVFALLGYELVEGAIRNDQIREVARVSFAPLPVHAVRN